jgi:hypothetical protein
MSAVIKAKGEHFDVDAFLLGCTLPVCSVYRRGQPIFRRAGPVHMSSGVHTVASDADFDQFARQEAEATGFLRNHFEQLRRLRSFPGIESVTLHFGIDRRNVYIQCDSLSPELVTLAGSLGLGISLSIYPGPHESPPDAEEDYPAASAARPRAISEDTRSAS